MYSLSFLMASILSISTLPSNIATICGSFSTLIVSLRALSYLALAALINISKNLDGQYLTVGILDRDLGFGSFNIATATTLSFVAYTAFTFADVRFRYQS